jgi:O-antigen/teichoic acid export membrane protein
VTASWNWRRSAIARNTLWVAIGQVFRVGMQAVYFVLVARALGARDFGAYASVLALVAIATPFATLGSGNLLVKHVARTPARFPQEWGRALATTLLSGTLLLGLVVVISRVWLPTSVPLSLVLTIGAADLLFVRLVEIATQAYQAHQRMARTAVLQLLLSPLRLVAAVGLVALFRDPTALDWGWAYLVSSIVGAGSAVALVNRELGAPVFLREHLGSEFREGALFAVTLSAQSTTNDVDKTLMARLGTLEATGVYAAAYRLVDVAFLPVGSLLIATYARFFQHGVQGVRATAVYAQRLLGVGASYGLTAAVMLYLGAPALPYILGDQYRDSVAAIRWLSILPLLKAIHYFGADALTGAGYQGVRTVVLVIVAVMNVLLNLALIPAFSWRGAAVATIVSDALMGLGIWGCVWYLGRRSRHLRPPEPAPSVVEAGY